jgi:hypothetical protein
MQRSVQVETEQGKRPVSSLEAEEKEENTLLILKKLRGFSPQANCTDHRFSAKLVPTFAV